MREDVGSCHGNGSWQQDELGPFPADHQTMAHKDFRFPKSGMYLEKKKGRYLSYKESHCPTPHCLRLLQGKKSKYSFCWCSITSFPQ